MVHIPKEKRTKLEPKSLECILLGYSSESKACRLYNKATKSIEISRDVIFFETDSEVSIDTNIQNNYVFSPVEDDICSSEGYNDECELQSNIGNESEGEA